MIYVDPLRSCIPNRKWKYRQSCHMFSHMPEADCSERAMHEKEELIDFAVKIGMMKHWVQEGRFPHYDLNPNMRKRAIAFGADECDLNLVCRKIREG